MRRTCICLNRSPSLLTFLNKSFFILEGRGNPNSDEFAEKVNVLYSLAYAVRMMPKQGFTPEGYFEYTVYPLEGLWDLTEEGRKMDKLDKDQLIYSIMIRQPDFVTEQVAVKALETARKKNPHPLLDEVRFDAIEDGLSVQMLHVGPYDTEPETFAIMKEFIEENQLKIRTLRHREIYLSDARKVEPEKLKTVLRYMVSR